jgi:hypothetical protein
LIGIIGDRPNDGDRRCDDKCRLQIEGTGGRPSDVQIIGARDKDNAIRADRADGIAFRNSLIQYSDFNNIYVHETNGFHHDRLIARWSREYGLLSFTSDHGLYENIEGYGTGDSAIYPGSGPQRERCGAFGHRGAQRQLAPQHDRPLGHRGRQHIRPRQLFHHNAAGITMDSFASGHTGMPQDCSRFENNRVFSNNEDYFSDGRDQYCRDTPPEKRNRRIVCPSFQVPVGTGIMIGGGNGNGITGNHIYDNWRNGVRLLRVPAFLRGEDDPTKTYDTSHQNRFIDNRMGVRPDGRRDPNGYDRNPLNPNDHGDGYGDFWWDEEGNGNCWKGNRAPGGSEPTRVRV